MISIISNLSEIKRNSLKVAPAFFILFIPLAILIGGIFALFYLKEINAQRNELIRKEADRLNTQKEVIKIYIETIATDVLTISRHYELRLMLDNREQNPRDSLAKEFLWFSRIKRVYDQVRYLDEHGMEILRVNFNAGQPVIIPQKELQPKGERYYFKDTFALAEGEVFVSPFDLNIEYGEIEHPLKPMIRFGTPVFDNSGKKRGVVLLNFLGANLLRSFDVMAKSGMGSLLLLNSEGFYLRGFTPETEWGFMYENKKDATFAKDYLGAWEEISRFESGQFSDSSGTFIFTTIRPFTEAQISSTGSGAPFTPSEKLFQGTQYNWKLICYLPPVSFILNDAPFLSKPLWVVGTMLGLLAVGCGFVAFASIKRKEAEREVRRHRDHLKDLVDQRTAELKKVNVQLQKDINRRKRMEKEKAALEKQLLQTQRLEAIGNLAGGVAHDYNNMLSVIIGYAEIALDALETDDPLYADIEEILKAGTRSKEITRQLLAFARQQAITPQVLDLNQIVESILKMLRRLIGEDIDLVWSPGQELWMVKIDPSQVDQIVANLCVNARDAVTGRGKIVIETQNASVKDLHQIDCADGIVGDFVLLTVADDGCGMDDEIKSRIYEPFFTTKELGRGTGLGLSTVYGIVKQNNGFIDLYSEPGLGTTFRIYLPKYQGGLVEDSKHHPEGIPSWDGEKVMVVEDDPATLRLVERILKTTGCSTIAAKRPTDALELARMHKDDIALLITDVIMPEMSGQELAGRLSEYHPHIKCLYMSGYTADVIARHGIFEDDFHFIQKPFSTRELSAKVREVLDE